MIYTAVSWRKIRVGYRMKICVFCLVCVSYFTFNRMAFSVNPEFTRMTSAKGRYKDNLPLCPASPKGLVNNVSINTIVPTWMDLEGAHMELLPGGRWTPQHCMARHRLAVIVPYRDRETNLKLFLQHMHPFLQKQNVQYGIYTSEQFGADLFNRGIARNVGFLEAMKIDRFDCVIFHDVDLLPINEMNLYMCPDVPRHMCAGLDYQSYKPLYRLQAYFGGVVSMQNDQFKNVNGYSNLYFGWGAEDDDLYIRFSSTGTLPLQYPVSLGKYNALSHTRKSDRNMKRFHLLSSASQRMHNDGLNSLHYTLLSSSRRTLFTHFSFGLNESSYKYQAEQLIAASDRVDAKALMKQWVGDLINI